MQTYEYKKETYLLNGKIISPVSILSGDTFDLMAYYVYVYPNPKNGKHGWIFPIDKEKFINMIIEQGRFDALRRIIASMSGSTDKKEPFQNILKSPDLDLPKELQNVGKWANGNRDEYAVILNREIARDLHNGCYAIHKVYRAPVISRHSEKDGSEVTEVVKYPIVTGSSLKGSMRTAYIVAEMKKKQHIINDLIKKDAMKKIKYKNGLLKELVKYNRRVEYILPSNAKKDSWRRIVVEDSEPINHKNVFVDRVIILNADRTSGTDDIPFYVEALKPDTEFKTSLSFINTNVGNVYDRSFEYEWNARQFFDMIKRGVRLMLDTWIYGFADIDDRATLIPNEVKQSTWPKNTLYLPVGFGTGWMFKTIGALLDDKSIDIVKKIAYEKSDKDYFPSTYRKSKTFSVMPGWVKITFSKKNA